MTSLAMEHEQINTCSVTAEPLHAAALPSAGDRGDTLQAAPWTEGTAVAWRPELAWSRVDQPLSRRVNVML